LPIVSTEFLRSGALRTVAALSLSAVGLLTLAASPLTLAQATTAPAAPVPVAPVPAESAVKKPAAKETDEKGVQKLTEFVVSADKPYTDRNVDIPRTINDVQPYYIFKSETIEEINSVDVNTFLKEQLSMNTASSSQSIVQPVAGGNGNLISDIDLRGMGSSRTLVLINGRRAAPAQNRGAFGQVDLNTIPLSAIEQIIVLPGGASAIYGGAASGGVINVVLKKNYTGGAVAMTYGDVFKGSSRTRSGDATLGFSLGAKTHVMLTANYKDRIPPTVGDRLYIRDYDARVMANVPNGAQGSRWTATSPYPGELCDAQPSHDSC
jgi:outer membrane receptor protein involved in Fe transport